MTSLDKWSRTPKHILRRKCIEDAVKDIIPGYFLEFGPGNGDLTKFFLDRNFFGKCYDIGSETKIILKDILKEYKNIEVLENLEALSENCFDYLFAFEVLEHIKEDVSILKSWTKYLKEGGILLLSVPAHMKKFGIEDEMVGHYRRYDRKDILMMLEQCGYHDIKLYSYGFPLGNITRNISLLMNKNKVLGGLTMEERSILSGIKREERTNYWSFLYRDPIIYPFAFIQQFFYKSDLGDGYVVCAKKVGA